MRAFTRAFRILKSDKWVLTLSLIPVLLGIGIYSLIGTWLYGDILNWGQNIIEGQVSGGWASFIAGIFIALLTVIFYFLISWTFVLVVSLVAAPFNDLMSERVEKLIEGEKVDSVAESLKNMLGRFVHVIFNEIKKITVILLFSFIGLLLGLLFPPISIAFSIILMAVEFVDYSWGRDELTLTRCFKDLKRGFLPYTLSGAVFLFIVGIPIVNLVAIPLGVIYYTILYVENKHKEENVGREA